MEFFKLRSFRISIFWPLVLAATVGMHSIELSAKELQEFYRGVRPMAMGNAFTAVADDHDSIFYNPAGIAMNRHMEIDIFNLKLDASEDNYLTYRSYASSGATSSSLAGEQVRKFFDKNFFMQGTIFPSIHIPNFAVGYLYSGDFHFTARNTVKPEFDLRYLFDRGIVAGTGIETRGLLRRDFMRLGATVKWIKRSGFDGVVPLSDIITGPTTNYFKSLGGEGSGIGVTVGMQYEMLLQRKNDLLLGVSWMDIGNTQFGARDANKRPPDIKNNLAAGAAWQYRFGQTIRSRGSSKLSVEFRHLTQLGNIDPLLQFHAGAEINAGDFSFQVGINQDSLTGGINLDLYFFRISAATYGVENQSLGFMDRERRYMFQLTFSLDIFGKKIPTLRDVSRSRRPRIY